MTEHLPDQDLIQETADQPQTSAKADVPAFRFPFSPANFAPRQAAAQPWQKGSNPRHEKKIGMAPKGTRRSMGKR